MVAIFVVANRSYFSIILLLLQLQQQQVVLVVAAAAAAAAAATVRDVTPTSSLQTHYQQKRQQIISNSISSRTNSRNLQSIADLWSMNEPNLEYESTNNNGNKQFRITYEVNDMIEDAMFKTTFWSTTDCSSGNIPLDDEGLGYKFISTTNIPIAPAGDGSGVRTFDIDFEITDEEIIRTNKFVYTESDKQILVCVRSSLQTMNGITVNYLETILQFDYIFNGSFFVEEINLTPYDEPDIAFVSDSILDAYDCTDDPIGNTANVKTNNGNGNSDGNNGNGNDNGNNGKRRGKVQGTVFRVCVQPKPEALLKGYRMRAVESFRFESNEEVGEKMIVQQAIENRGQSKKNDLTRLQCNRGQGQCVIETLLAGDFYTKERLVWAKGSVTLQLGLDDGASNAAANGKTSNDNGNSGNAGNPNGNNGNSDNNGNGNDNGNNGIGNGVNRHLLRSVRRGLQQADTDVDADVIDEEGLLEDVNVGMGVLSNGAPVTTDDNNTKEMYKMTTWRFFSFQYSMGASIVLILFIIFNVIACLIHVIDYRKQQKIVKEMEKMRERLSLLSQKI